MIERFFFHGDETPLRCRVARRVRPLAALIVAYRVNSAFAFDPRSPRAFHLPTRLRSLWWAMNAYHWGGDFKC